VLEQNDGDLSIWMTSELPTALRIRDWFIEVPTKSEKSEDKNFEIFKRKVKEEELHNWDDIFYIKLLSWTKNNRPNLNEVVEIKKFVYEILTRNLRWVECVHFLLDVIIQMKELNEPQRLRLLEVLANTEATSGGITLPSYRIPIVWENLFINLRNAIIDGVDI
jgi:hypothetical protein